MSRTSCYYLDFKNKRWGNCSLLFYPACDELRPAEIEMIELPDTIFTEVGELSGEFKDLPVGLSLFQELKISLKLQNIPEEVLGYIVEPRSSRSEFLFGTVETENIWIFKSDLNLGGALSTIFIGTQELQKVKKTSAESGRATFEINLTHALVSMGRLTDSRRLGHYLYFALDVDSLPKFAMREAVWGIDIERNDIMSHRKYFQANNNGTNANPLLSTLAKEYYGGRQFDFGIAKFFLIKDIFSGYTDLCRFDFLVRSSGLDFAFKIENPYSIITFFQQNSSASADAEDAIGVSLAEGNIWILGFYNPDLGRAAANSDNFILGFFYRPQMWSTENSGYPSMWEAMGDMVESCVAKAVVIENEVSVYPVFHHGNAAGPITPPLEDLSSKAEFEESYMVLEEVLCEKIDGSTEHDIDSYKVSNPGATGDGQQWSIGRMLLTNAPSVDNSLMGRTTNDDDLQYGFYTPFPENRIYYFADGLSSGLGVAIRVHHHCIIKISNTLGDDSSTIVPQYVGDTIFGKGWDKFSDHLLKIQMNSTLPYIAIKLFLNLFSKPKQGKLTIDTRHLRSLRYSYLGQEHNLSPDTFAAGQFEHISSNSYLLKTGSSFTAEPGTLSKAELFVRGE